MSEFIDRFIGLCLGVGLGFIFGYSLAADDAAKGKADCELTLPRNQVCEMQYVPKIKDGK